MYKRQAINRVPESNEFLRARPYWTTMLANRLKESSPINMTLTSDYDSSSRELKVTVRVAYTAEVSTKHRLTLAITENNIVDAQEESLPGQADIVAVSYTHLDVYKRQASRIALWERNSCHCAGENSKVFPTAGRMRRSV